MVEHEDNIFEAARKQAMKKKSLASKPAPAKPAAAPTPSESTQKISDEELERMLNRIFDLRDDLDKKLEIIVKKSGLQAKQIEALATLGLVKIKEIPENIQQLEKQHRQLDVQFQAVTGKSLKTAKADAAKAKKQKALKGKSLGSRRKWMPMR